MDNYSVLMTVYFNDSPTFLIMAIDSMLKQTKVTNDFVLVLDGELPDSLNEVIDSYRNKYNVFNILQLPKNVGLGSALNAGLGICKNNLIARLDADDISLPNRCELQQKEFILNSQLVIVGSDMYEFENDDNNCISIKKMPSTKKQILRYAKTRNPFNHSTVMFKKDFIIEMGGYSSRRRSQDVELFSKIVFNNYDTMNINKPLVKFRMGDSRIIRKKNWENIISDLSVYKSFYNKKYINLFHYLKVIIMQVVFFILPVKLSKFLYSKLIHTKLT
ncbi:MAG: glycosyltransferase [Pleomorphochaeta sp.]